MTDEHFECFLKDLPLSIVGPACTDEHTRGYAGLVPDCLISYWQDYGFSGFGNGTAWLVDPIEWKGTIDEILLDGVHHPILDADACFITFMRSAFGKVWFWTPGYGISLIVDAARGILYPKPPARKSSPSGLELAMHAFFGASSMDRFEFYDRNEHPMFERTYQHLGALQFDELYGFAPGLMVGGTAMVEATHLFQIHVHMALLRAAIGDSWYVVA